MRTILLGGNGFIGKRFVELYHKSSDITVISRNSPLEFNRVDGVTYIQGDCSNIDFLSNALQPNDNIVLLAYNSIPKTTFDDPLSDIYENLPIAINVLNVLRDIPVRRLLYISSGGTIYGPTSRHNPISESHQTNPISPYGITKLAMEKYCMMYSKLFGIPLVIARPANPYGPGQNPYRGQGFVATAIAKILRNEPLTVFGEFGTIRDYLYIDDLCEAIKILLTYEIGQDQIFNIGSGNGLNNIEIIKAVVKAAGLSYSKVALDMQAPRKFDVEFNVLDNKLIREMGWKITTSIESGLAKTIPWVKSCLK